MKIKLLSDLHLEGRHGYQNKVHEWAQHLDEDVLVLAGDIAVGPENVVEAIKYFQDQGFPRIIYVAGNHELYHHSRKDYYTLKRCVSDMANVNMLDANEIIKIDDVSFFGGTLWTNFGNDPIAKSAARNGINDFRVIADWSVDAAEAEYVRQVEFIKTAASITEGKKVIVTHFLPAMECVAERYKSEGVTFLLNKYFANNLGDWISYQSNTTWLFGHTHDAMDFTIGETRLISNPLGYAREHIPDFARFDSQKVIEV